MVEDTDIVCHIAFQIQFITSLTIYIYIVYIIIYI